MKKAGKHIVWWLFILLLVVPVVQRHFPFVKTKKLEGFIPLDSIATLSDTAWFGGSYQKSMEEHASREIGFHEDMVRLRNQMDYSLFGILHTQNATEGLDSYFFRRSAYFAYNGAYLNGRNVAYADAVKMKILQEELSERNKPLLICIAPGKIDFYKEFTDTALILKDPHKNHYDVYKQYYDEFGVNYHDMNQWFLDIKDTVSVPIMSKGGVHWTVYGSALAYDSLLEAMHQSLGSDNWKEMKVLGPKDDFIQPYMDKDITNALNLIQKLDELPLRYPKLQYSEDTTARKPKLFIVGDSYVHAPLWNGLVKETTDPSGTFWYYNKQAYNIGNGAMTPTTDHNLSEVIDQNETILLLYNVSNLARQYSGFVDSALASILPSDLVVFDSIQNLTVQLSFDSLMPTYSCKQSGGLWLTCFDIKLATDDRFISYQSNSSTPVAVTLNKQSLEITHTDTLENGIFMHHFQIPTQTIKKKNRLEIREHTNIQQGEIQILSDFRKRKTLPQ